MHSLSIVHRDIHPRHCKQTSGTTAFYGYRRRKPTGIVLIDFSKAELVESPISFSECGTSGYRLSEVKPCYNVYTADVYAAALTMKHFYNQLVRPQVQ